MSKIEWTEKTWNPIVGCSIVSPGCTNCYAMMMAARLQMMSKTQFPQYQGTTQPSKAGPVWTGKISLAPEATLLAPLRRKKPTTYFVNSMGDLFHEDVPDAWIDRVFAVMTVTPQHTYQILTKRSARLRKYFSADEGFGPWGRVEHRAKQLFDIPQGKTLATYGGSNLPNVWLGVSAERQQEADVRIPDLLATPAAVRFGSAEPLLGPIDFTRYIWEGDEPGVRPWPRLDWIIAGGESGPGARPMHPDWARSIRDQCSAAGVPFFFKQWGEWAPGECANGLPTKTELTADWFSGTWQFSALTRVSSETLHRDDEPTCFRLGKKAAGRTIDGVLHDATPARATGAA